MYNYYFLIGKIIKIEDFKSVGILEVTISVQRPFKEMDGSFKSDEFKVTFFAGFADFIKDYLKQGAFVGIKGRLAMIKGTLTIIGERIVDMSQKD